MYDSMPFGKFKGVPFDEVDSPYLLYALEHFHLAEELKDEIKSELSQRIENAFSDRVITYTDLRDHLTEHFGEDIAHSFIQTIL